MFVQNDQHTLLCNSFKIKNTVNLS